MIRRMLAAVGLAKPQPTRRVVQLRGNYDAAQTTDANKKWWAAADSLSAAQANNPGVRAKLRHRARYEAANNSYAAGIVRTVVTDTIGERGPRLQMSGTMSPENARLVETRFMSWCAAIGLADKLATMRRARSVDGESIGLLTTNPRLPGPVQLDLKLVEADQLCAPMMGLDLRRLMSDGIDFDASGNPTIYHILRAHPGDLSPDAMVWDPIPAAQVVHDFRADRPGQIRGVPELTPALPLFQLQRAWTLATLGAAEAIANFAAVAFTDSPGDEGADDVAPLESMELERNMLTSLPRGWKIGQIKPEQPASTYREFKRELVAECARALNVPFIVAAGDSSDSSYATGRMDHLCYRKSIAADRAHIESVILERLFAAWRDEAVRIEGYLPQALRTVTADWTHGWMWGGFEHVDPSKEATAQQTRLTNLTATLADEWAKAGEDWETKLELIAKIEAKKKALAEKYGITFPAINTGGAQQQEDPEDEPPADPVEASFKFERDASGRLMGVSHARP